MTPVPHQTVLLEEAVHALMTNRSGTYVDCTYGRGGHSQAIVDSLDADGRLLVVDRDEAAVAHAEERFKDDDRVVIAHGSFSQLGSFLERYQIQGLDGVLMDLGVSSPQIDEAERGFSFQQSGPLDMRMNRSEGQTAAEWLADASEQEIIDVLKRYGEERFARRIAKKIVEARVDTLIDTTDKLVEIVETSIPRREKHKHPATRTFQAIRIQVNRELEELENCLTDVIELLNSGGRLVVISFHSLEDRIVKRFFRRMARGEELPSRLPIRDAEIDRHVRILGKPVKPSDKEVANNRRARSSIMRIAEKL
ncbi:MAG: 16S rRNA (cytosine(1402)-N(4))-methyltransferase RsmH [Pseudomonadales bacterium]|nr:16S rRNA (cytosine(1402)-N(4))-methyltransferase RsmH [Pseudomonadales bacterium]MBO6594254.1 16S rRNA (cytosine(1402)-N(4))-methyltransferase RsmH [Pseudomonadales bacterium]MBO6656283.1 16S rRNA (cytosine(1402)-N(4))-methyltransferase RsmH [Pseudomonadales bacterium]MBO6822185.1 16S rRNA (cytosine(1402)-N(4))-methyltransferase RsmH [Pseudomonadales bacterium]